MNTPTTTDSNLFQDVSDPDRHPLISEGDGPDLFNSSETYILRA